MIAAKFIVGNTSITPMFGRPYQSKLSQGDTMTDMMLMFPQQSRNSIGRGNFYIKFVVLMWIQMIIQKHRYQQVLSWVDLIKKNVNLFFI